MLALHRYSNAGSRCSARGGSRVLDYCRTKTTCSGRAIQAARTRPVIVDATLAKQRHWKRRRGITGTRTVRGAYERAHCPMTAISKKIRVPDLALMKKRRERIVMLTAYDATMARVLDQAGVDLLLVGDSLGNVILGLDTTVPVTLDAVVHHTRAVALGARRALVVADMPFLTYQISVEQAMQNAGRLFQEGGAAAVKIEGGRPVAHVLRRLTSAGLPVMGHIGLTPQHVHRLGGMRRQARDEASSARTPRRCAGTGGCRSLCDRPRSDSRRRCTDRNGSTEDSYHRHRCWTILRRPGPCQLRHAGTL